MSEKLQDRILGCMADGVMGIAFTAPGPIAAVVPLEEGPEVFRPIEGAPERMIESAAAF